MTFHNSAVLARYEAAADQIARRQLAAEQRTVPAWVWPLLRIALQLLLLWLQWQAGGRRSLAQLIEDYNLEPRWWEVGLWRRRWAARSLVHNLVRQAHRTLAPFYETSATFAQGLHSPQFGLDACSQALIDWLASDPPDLDALIRDAAQLPPV